MQLTLAAFAVLACFAISCNASRARFLNFFPATALNDLGIVWRHQFQYFMTKTDTASKTAVHKVWDDMTYAWNKTNGGIVTLAFNSDLGLAAVLYPGNKGANADFAGRVDFRSQAALTAFWKFAYTQTVYTTMLRNFVKPVGGIVRIQYLAKTSLYGPGDYYRSSFEYNWNAPVTSDKVQAINVMWTTWANTSPVKPQAFAAGADLGLASTLYPTPNWNFGGSITFNTLDDLKKFWAWLYAKPEYKAMVATIDSASRIQYVAGYSGAIVQSGTYLPG